MSALIADDSATVRRLLIKALAATGIADVVEAADGTAALRALASRDYSFVLLDWSMPERTGVDVLRAFRQRDSRTPVVILVADAEKAHVIEAIRAGASDCLLKPFTVEQVAAKIRHVLCTARSADPASGSLAASPGNR